MTEDELKMLKKIVLGHWKASEFQWESFAEGVSRYEFKSVLAVVKEVFRTGAKGFGNAVEKMTARCRENANAELRFAPAKKKAEEWAPPTEGSEPGELCDAAYAGTLTGPLANATPRGKAWMRAIGEKRARARAEGREPFEPSGAELIFAATSMGQSRLGKPSKRDTKGAAE